MRNILVVDDEETQRHSLRRGLTVRGYGVHLACGGREALKYINDPRRSVDLVLTDFAMPGMNGLELLRRIRHTNIMLPVIMMTAYGDKDLVIEAMKYHCDGFIEKPFTMEDLLASIGTVEGHHESAHKCISLARDIPKLAHQINNPLMSIMGMAELSMLQVQKGETRKRRFEAIIAAAKKISEINRHMIGYGRSIINEASKCTVDMQMVVDECLEMFSGLLRLKHISVQKDVKVPRCDVLMNRFELEQVVTNLIANAIDAMEGRGERLLRITLAQDNSAGFHILSILDTGLGIPPEYREAIFDSYFTTKENGTGLGLAVVRDTVERHGGRIELGGEVGKGTCFRVWLPVSAKENDLVENNYDGKK